MQNIVIFEETNLNRIRIKKLLLKHGFVNFEFLDHETMAKTYYLKLNVKTAMYLVNDDNRGLNTEKIFDLIQSKGTKAPIIVMTSHSDAYSIKHLMSLGASDILSMPFSDAKFMEKIFAHTGKPSLEPIEPTNDNTTPTIDSTNSGNAERYMLDWHTDFEIGVKTIDDEHRGLIEKYERLYQKMRSGGGFDYYKELSDYLKNYVMTHFTNEELIQETIGYPDIENHKTLHKAFEDDLMAFTNANKKEQLTSLDLIRFNLFIKNWLMHHILVEDRNIGNFIIANDITLQNQ